MVCEFFLLSSIWFVVVIFWMETISMWLFLCHLFQDRAMYQWGDRIYVSHPDQIMYVIIRTCLLLDDESCLSWVGSE